MRDPDDIFIEQDMAETFEEAVTNWDEEGECAWTGGLILRRFPESAPPKNACPVCACPICACTEKRKGATALDGKPYKFTRCAKCGYEFVREPWTEREEP